MSNPNPACWRSSNHQYAVNLAMVALIECPEWELEDVSPKDLRTTDDEFDAFDVTITFSSEATAELSLKASDYWSLLNAFEIFLSTR